MQLITHDATVDKPFTLCPLGDIQYNGTATDMADALLLAHIQRCLSLDGRFVGLGDYIDFVSPSGRQRIAAAGHYDNALDTLAHVARALNLGVISDFLGETKGKWLGMLSGHHYYYQDGYHSDVELASMLGAPYLGTCAYVELRFGQHSVLIWLHHGNGGGQKSYAPVQKLEHTASAWEANIFLIGHMTKQAVSTLNRVYPVHQNGKVYLQHKPIYLVGCGGWSKAYMLDRKRNGIPQGDYVEARMMNPVVLGAPIITITPRFEKGVFDPIIHVEV